MCLNYALFILQKKSYFTSRRVGPSQYGPLYRFHLFEDESLAFRYVNGIVILENYANRPHHTATSFQFVMKPVPNVKFSDDCTA